MRGFRTICIPVITAFAIWHASAQQRWTIDEDGEGIYWEVTEGNIPHYDHIEMSGRSVAFVLRWGIDETGAFRQERSLVFPLLRTVPNNTHASLMHRIGVDIPGLLSINGLVPGAEKVLRVEINGVLTAESVYSTGKSNKGSIRNANPAPVVSVRRSIFPSVSLPLMCERYTVTNITDRRVSLSIPQFSQVFATDPAKGTDGAYIIRGDIIGAGTVYLEPSASVVFDTVFQAYRAGETMAVPNVETEYKARMEFVSHMDSNLVLNTPEKAIDRVFRFAKIRAAESIIRTKGGYMHAPGGESYYAAIWANDQAEYVNPFFPFTGYGTGNESALNSFRHFARFMNPGYEPIPSSIIAEGTDIWNGAGDRGDGAMIAYGAARYALARGDRAEAEELWPLIEWCLEYCRRQLNEHGVVRSDSDELEGRFPAGDANLCTSSLYYDALISASYLGRELGISPSKLAEYRSQAVSLRDAIERYFGAEVSGYDTYRYYDGNTLLRSWICIPLTAGITDRAKGTAEALLGPELMTPDGILTQQGSDTFWDRATLYALRGIYTAGYQDKATEQLLHYSNRRLLGDHVPYPIEAWPEGSQRHLSAESGLYCRIITEGLFGIRPTGLRSFDLTPRLPSGWDRMSLEHIRAFGSDFEVCVERAPRDRINVTVKSATGKIKKYSVRNGDIVRNVSL